jgi:hypothetical protein
VVGDVPKKEGKVGWFCFKVQFKNCVFSNCIHVMLLLELEDWLCWGKNAGTGWPVQGQMLLLSRPRRQGQLEHILYGMVMVMVFYGSLSRTIE